MTENEKLRRAIEEEKELYEIAKDRYEKLGVKNCKDRAEEHELMMNWLEELQQYRAIGTVEEFKALKEKNTPMELAEHNFQDEVHHYLCPSCRNIVSFNQNYCEECGQALET